MSKNIAESKPTIIATHHKQSLMPRTYMRCKPVTSIHYSITLASVRSLHVLAVRRNNETTIAKKQTCPTTNNKTGYSDGESILNESPPYRWYVYLCLGVFDQFTFNSLNSIAAFCCKHLGKLWIFGLVLCLEDLPIQ